MYKHILVSLDGSEIAEQVLPHVEALAEKFGAAVTLLRATMPPVSPVMPTPVGLPVTPDVTGTYIEVAEAGREVASEYLGSVAERLRSHGLQVTQELPEGPAAEAILERAEAVGADLIALATHGRGGLERLVLGSVAEEVVRKSSCPVLLVRARPEARHPE
jgi:nucleotide-binding universal stress UspA family protein